jgi:hypothetical protein
LDSFSISKHQASLFEDQLKAQREKLDALKLASLEEMEMKNQQVFVRG